MGWWKVKDIQSGGIDWAHTCPTNAELVNAVPSVDDAQALYNGDGPADLMGDALRAISHLYEEEWGRPATKEELIAVFNFCCNGMFADEKSNLVA